MTKPITLNGSPALMDTNTQKVCSLPQNHKLVKNDLRDIVDVFDLDTGELVLPFWRRVATTDRIEM